MGVDKVLGLESGVIVRVLFGDRAWVRGTVRDGLFNDVIGGGFIVLNINNTF